MPTYDFRCRGCGSVFKAFTAMDAAPPPCIVCGETADKAIVTPPAIHSAMARGRDLAAASIPQCGKGCRCCP